MLPSDTTRLSRMRACRSDLLANDIALNEADHLGLGELSRRHLDYFQLMLGYDVAPGELVSLAKRIRPAPRHSQNIAFGAESPERSDARRREWRTRGKPGSRARSCKDNRGESA